MERILRSTTLLFLLVVAVSGVVVASERELVFRDLAWNDPIDALDRHRSWDSPDEPGIVIAEKTNELLSLGEIPVKKIQYFFFQNRLMKIRVEIDPQGKHSESYALLLATLENKYGDPTHKPFLGHTRQWQRGSVYVKSVWEIFGDQWFELWSPDIEKEYKVWLEQYKKDLAASSATAW